MAIAKFGENVVRITQGPNGNISHQGRLAYDLGGEHYGAAGAIDTWSTYDSSWIIMSVQSGGDHFVYFQSSEPLIWADGTVDFVTLAMCHMDNTSGYKIGTSIGPNATLYKEGTYSGGRSGVVDPHIHVQVGRGKFVGTLQAKPYKLPNEVRLEQVFAVPDNAKIVAGAGLNWIRVSAVDIAQGGVSQDNGTPNISLSEKVFEIGPVSKGDYENFLALCTELRLKYKTVETDGQFKITIGPVSSGDANTIYSRANSLGNIPLTWRYANYVMEIGPVSLGDYKTIIAEAKRLDIGYYDTQSGELYTVFVGSMSYGDKNTFEALAKSLSLHYTITAE